MCVGKNPGYRRLGQVFASSEVIDRISEYISTQIIKDIRGKSKEAGRNDGPVILEIGAGDGRLTEKLSQMAKTVYAVEIDKGMCERLMKKFKDKNVRVICKDILKLDGNDLREGPNGPKPKIDIVVGNVPYYISSKLIKKLAGPASSASIWSEFNRAVLMFQKEFVEKLLGRGKDMTGVSVICQNYFLIERLFKVNRGQFVPQPRVDSVVIQLVRRKQEVFDERELGVILSMFNDKKKTMKNHVTRYIRKYAKVGELNGQGLSERMAEEMLRGCGIEPKERVYNVKWDRLKKLTRLILELKPEG